MTTLTIHLPIAPGAKTCEGCPKWENARILGSKYTREHGHQPYRYCEQYGADVVARTRLPECIAAEKVKEERVKVSEWWEARDEDNSCWSAGTETRVDRFIAGDKSFRKVHVTRYRRAK